MYEATTTFAQTQHNILFSCFRHTFYRTQVYRTFFWAKLHKTNEQKIIALVPSINCIQYKIIAMLRAMWSETESGSECELRCKIVLLRAM